MNNIVAPIWMFSLSGWCTIFCELKAVRGMGQLPGLWSHYYF